MDFKVGLVISVYDKVDDLEICIELAKKAGFHSILVVAENESAAKSALADSNVERVHFLESCEFKPSNDKFEFFKSITNRVWSAQRTGLRILARETDFVMHTHADGWILDGESVNSVIKKLDADDLDFAFRGMGFTFINFPGSPTGTIDDHFYIVRSSTILASKFINKPLIDFLPGYFNIHGILSTWIISEIGLSKSFHYDDTKKWKNWDGSRRNYANGNPLRPFVYSEEHQLLHCHSDDFPENLGRAIQAMYLLKAGHSEYSTILKNFVTTNLDGSCIEKLQRIYKFKSRSLKRYLDFDEDYKNLDFIERKLNLYRKTFIKSIFNNALRCMFRPVFRKVSKGRGGFFPLTIQQKYASTISVVYKSEAEDRAYKKFLKQ